MEVTRLNRREFLKRTGIVGSAGVLYSVSACGVQDAEYSVEPWLYLSVGSDTLEFVLPRTEMGQDLATSFVMILSEEMALPIARFEVGYAKADTRFGQQMTVGSGSIRDWWQKLRVLGGQVRALVESRAAVKLGCAPTDLEILDGKVKNRLDGSSVDYLDLLAEGWPKQLPKVPVSKSKTSLNVVGENTVSLLAADKVSGRFHYVADATEGASVALTVPYPLGTAGLRDADLESFRKEYSLSAVFDLKEVAAGYGAVALVGDATWPLIQCKKSIAERLYAAANIGKRGESPFDEEVSRREGKLAESEGSLELVFQTPAIAHAPMETEASVAEFDGAACRVWAPTQAPQQAKAQVAKTLSIAEDKVELQTVPAGGAFGRKRYSDFVIESVLISKGLYERQLKSRVKLIWLREDDLAREHYRPKSWQRLAWNSNSPNELDYQLLEARAPDRKSRSRELPQLEFLDWQFKGKRHAIPGASYPGIWRSVEHGYMAFALCSFMDELSYKHGQDPIDYFLSKMAGKSLIDNLKGWIKPGNRYDPERLKSLVAKVRQSSGWDGRETPQNSGVGYGFSAYTCFDSYIALVAKVAVNNGQLKVEKVWVAVDCGVAINPDGIKAQVEGGVIFGMSACLWAEMPERDYSFDLNFGDYLVARMKDSPDVEVTIVESDANPSGVGELAVPVIAPAIANAVRSVVGVRLMSMPFLSAGVLKG